MKQFLFSIILLSALHVRAQVAVNASGANPAPSAMLDVNSTTKGMLMPRMTALQRKAVVAPETGLMVFDLDRNTPYLFDGSQWRPLMFTTDKLLPLLERSNEADDPGFYGMGNAVDLWQDYAIVGAGIQKIGANTEQGAAYIYHKSNSNWLLQQKLVGPSGSPKDEFGTSVAIYNDIAVVGAPGKTVLGETSAGSVYVYKRTGTTWNLLQTLISTNPQTDDVFGQCIAVSNGKIAVGAPLMDYNGLVNSGSVFLYEYLSGQYSLVKQFKAQLPITDGEFGSALAMQNDRVAIGYPKYNTAAEGRIGSVNVFTYQPASGAWTEAIILAQHLQNGMKFGAALDMDGDSIIIGAPNYDIIFGSNVEKNDIGKVEVYRLVSDSWMPVWHYDEIQIPDNRLGYRVAIHDRHLMVAGKGFHGTENTVLYERPGDYGIKYFKSPYNPMSGFGQAIAIDGKTFIIGSQGESSYGSVHFGTLE